ncbi:MAG: NINE protein [Candidatus Obscuribacterales bacterium]|nr:NINE protein [Candidatus Obscuribacterales bacterium]
MTSNPENSDNKDSQENVVAGDEANFSTFEVAGEVAGETAQEIIAPFPTDDADLIKQARLINDDPQDQQAQNSINSDQADGSALVVCPDCKKQISENWLPQCPDCGANLVTPDQFAQVSTQAENESLSASTKQELAIAFKDWFQKGKDAFHNGNLEEAQANLRQAILRAPKSESSIVEDEEIEARELLAMILEKLGKADEAKMEYMNLSEEVNSSDEKNKFVLLAKNTGGEIHPKEVLERAVKNTEGSMQSLFCGSCRRPLLEAEVYAYKRSKSSFRCICGFEGSPLTYASNESSKQWKMAAAKHRALLIAAASPEVQGGRKQSTAVLLACTLGGLGGHKFYLDEYLMGSLYLILCWTLIPAAISILEAINLAHMSRVNFNLTYNLESILERLPEELKFAGQTHSDLLSMQRGEDEVSESDTF